MKQKIVLSYLTENKILDTCDDDLIALEKAKFWTARRMHLAKEYRKTHKSIKIFLSMEEHAHLTERARNIEISNTSFVKNAAIFAINKSNVLFRDQLLNLRKISFQILRAIEKGESIHEEIIFFATQLTQFIVNSSLNDN